MSKSAPKINRNRNKFDLFRLKLIYRIASRKTTNPKISIRLMLSSGKTAKTRKQENTFKF